MNVKDRMLKFLSKDGKYNTFTTAQARSMFGVTNVAARINELREEGYPIYTNQKTLSDGRKITYYRLGKANREVIAAGYRALRSQGINTFA